MPRSAGRVPPVNPAETRSQPCPARPPSTMSCLWRELGSREQVAGGRHGNVRVGPGHGEQGGQPQPGDGPDRRARVRLAGQRRGQLVRGQRGDPGHAMRRPGRRDQGLRPALRRADQRHPGRALLAQPGDGTLDVGHQLIGRLAGRARALPGAAVVEQQRAVPVPGQIDRKAPPATFPARAKLGNQHDPAAAAPGCRGGQPDAIRRPDRGELARRGLRPAQPADPGEAVPVPVTGPLPAPGALPGLGVPPGLRRRPGLVFLPGPSPPPLAGWLAAPAPVDPAEPAHPAAGSARARVSAIAAGALDPMCRPPRCVAGFNYVYFDIVVFSASGRQQVGGT